ncbi:hypothetical protein D3C84_916880 [compost metagenome]
MARHTLCARWWAAYSDWSGASSREQGAFNPHLVKSDLAAGQAFLRRLTGGLRPPRRTAPVPCFPAPRMLT